MALVVALLATCVRLASAHTSVLCTSISGNIPGRVTFWLGTYTHKDLAPNGAPGQAEIVDPAGKLAIFKFTSLCQLKRGVEEGGTIDYERALKSDCSALEKDGKKLIDMDSKVTCYNKHPKPFTTEDPVAIGERDVKETDINGYDSEITWFYALAMDRIQTGWHTLLTRGTDAILDPCEEDLPCSINATNKWWLEITAADGGAKCGAPPTALIANTDLGSMKTSFCTGVPSGFLCPVVCNGDLSQLGHLECENGNWSKRFSCGKTPCPLPSSENNAGINGKNGFPKGVQAASVGKNCGVMSEHGAVCEFTCSKPGSWGAGRIVCNAGKWAAEDKSASCKDQTEDSTWPAPVVLRVEKLGLASVKVFWTNKPDGKSRSPVLTYKFQIQPAGSLTCPDWPNRMPPEEEGLICDGGDPKIINTYQIAVQAVNAAGAGKVSAFVKPMIKEVKIFTWIMPEKMRWTIFEKAGSRVCSGGPYKEWYSEISVPGCELLPKTQYRIDCFDRYGEGWAGGYLHIHGEKYCHAYTWHKGLNYSSWFMTT